MHVKRLAADNLLGECLGPYKRRDLIIVAEALIIVAEALIIVEAL